MAHDDKVIKRYGSVEQKKAEMIKTARYKALQEVEWRKLAIKSWEALKKEAELGSRISDIPDTMVIGVLGEECFDSYGEYKSLYQKHPDKNFTQLASAMIEMNKQMVNSIEKVASNNFVQKKLVKTAATKTLNKDEVVNLAVKIAEKSNNVIVASNVVKFANSVNGLERLDIKTAKQLFEKNNLFKIAFSKEELNDVDDIMMMIQNKKEG